MQESNREHHEMVEAIAAHDPDRAQAAHMAHVISAKQRLIANARLT
ncbi:MAG TPA: FCD domain-containing protein [Ancylobacter sp.]